MEAGVSVALWTFGAIALLVVIVAVVVAATVASTEQRDGEGEKE